MDTKDNTALNPKMSLFKQKLLQQKKAKVSEEQNEEGFPKVFKLTDLPQNPIKQVEQKQEQIQQTSQNDNIKGLLEVIGEQNILKKEDIEKISQQNWKAISQMSQTDRERTVNNLKTQLPEAFLKQISNKQNFKVQKEQQPTLPNQDQQPLHDDSESWQDMLKVNIQTGKLVYTEQTRQNLIAIGAITLMIGSENNQSQIVGSRLAALLVSQLIEHSNQKTRQLAIISHIPLHLGIILEQVHFKLINFMLRQAKKTSFKSAYIEMATKSTESIVKSVRFLSAQCKNILTQTLQSLTNKKSVFDLKQEIIQQIKISLQSVVNLLKDPCHSLQNCNWETLTASLDFVIELLLIEQSQPAYRNSYLHNVEFVLEKCSDLTELIEIQHFLYELFNSLVLKKNKQQYLNISKIRDHWKGAIDITVLKISTKLNNIKVEVLFEIAFLARLVDGDTWNCLLGRINQIVHIRPELSHCLLFNTLADLKSNVEQEQIVGLNSMFSWLSSNIINNRFNPNYLLSALVQLFLFWQQNFEDLDQLILRNLIIEIGKHQLTNFQLVLNEQKVRTLVKNYGFNSLGNKAFTQLLLISAMKLNRQLQALILRQAIFPYLRHFADAAEHLYSHNCFTANKENGDLKEEITRKFRLEEEVSGNDKLLMYLSA